eukprot:5457136-Prymnesium_polylepis.1
MRVRPRSRSRGARRMTESRRSRTTGGSASCLKVRGCSRTGREHRPTDWPRAVCRGAPLHGARRVRGRRASSLIVGAADRPRAGPRLGGRLQHRSMRLSVSSEVDAFGVVEESNTTLLAAGTQRSAATRTQAHGACGVRW